MMRAEKMKRPIPSTHQPGTWNMEHITEQRTSFHPIHQGDTKTEQPQQRTSFHPILQGDT